jgi:hypothetical protein
MLNARSATIAVARRIARMADPTDPPAAETPLQRALRLKKAAQQTKTSAPADGRRTRERAAAAKSSAKSKPWMSR